MSKRIDANTAAHVELKASVSDLSELIVGQASNTNSRFTSVDQALKDVDRGVQVRHPRSFCDVLVMMSAATVHNP